MKTLGSIVLTLLCIAIQPSYADECQPVASLERIQGTVKVQPADAAFPLKKLTLPHALCVGDEVFSLKKSQALVTYAEGSVVLSAASKLKVKDASHLEALAGELLFEIKKQHTDSVQIHTPLIVIGVKGTRFLVSPDPAKTAVALMQGLIDVQRQDQQEVALYQAKPASDLDMQGYLEQVQQQYQGFVDEQNSGFEQYLEKLDAEFEAYVKSVELNPGRQLTFGQKDNKPMAVEEPVSQASDKLQEALAKWLN